jgi:SEC-C motif-containing protein
MDDEVPSGTSQLRESSMTSTHSHLLPRYKHLRQVSMRLNSSLVKTLPRDVLDEGGKRLGMLKGNKLILDSEDMSSVLMDFCIYDVRRQGLNAVERFLAESPPPSESEQMILLQAMREARYSLFVIERKEPGVGIHVRDLIRDEELFLMDVNFSQSADDGVVLAGRIYSPEGITQSTGATLPIGVLSPANREMILHSLTSLAQSERYHDPSPAQASELAASLIKACLKLGAGEHVRYEDPMTVNSSSSSRSIAPPSSRHIGRNDRCPCGSGKKFKHCCGAPR